MSENVDMVLKPDKKVVPVEAKGIAAPIEREQITIKVFCAKRDVAMALLEDFILIAGAQYDATQEKLTPEQMKILATNTHKFIIDLADRLMEDTGLNEEDIKRITAKYAKKPRGK
jgi:hypothetical protein